MPQRDSIVVLTESEVAVVTAATNTDHLKEAIKALRARTAVRVVFRCGSHLGATAGHRDQLRHPNSLDVSNDLAFRLPDQRVMKPEV